MPLVAGSSVRQCILTSHIPSQAVVQRFLLEHVIGWGAKSNCGIQNQLSTGLFTKIFHSGSWPHSPELHRCLKKGARISMATGCILLTPAVCHSPDMSVTPPALRVSRPTMRDGQRLKRDCAGARHPGPGNALQTRLGRGTAKLRRHRSVLQSGSDAGYSGILLAEPLPGY